MGFNAAEEVDPLDYDFTTLKPLPEGLEKAKGTVPEPSNERLEAFGRRFNRLQQLMNEADDARLSREAAALDKPAAKSKKSAMTTLDALEKWTTENSEQGEELPPELKKAEQVYIDLLDYVCQGSPSRAEIAAMPGRTRAAFMGWLVGELLVPKDWQSDTNQSLAAVPSV